MSLPPAQAVNLITIQTSRTFELCHQAPKVYQLDEDFSLKMTCAVIALFNASLKVTTEKMNGVEIYETAIMFTQKYTHESISDLMLCLKMAKAGELGTIYNRFDTATLFEFFNAYLEIKWSKYESKLASLKAQNDGSVNTEYNTAMIAQERQQKNKVTDEKWKEAVRMQEVLDMKRELNALKNEKELP